MINLHPSLLPSFKGADGIAQAYKAGVKITGCTVHWVTPVLDDGPIIDQKAVRVDPSDSLTQLEKIRSEHQLLPNVVARMSKGEIPQVLTASPEMSSQIELRTDVSSELADLLEAHFHGAARQAGAFFNRNRITF